MSVSLYTAELPQALTDSVTADGSDLCKYIRGFLNKYEKKGKKVVLTQISALNAPEPLQTALQKFTDVKGQKSGLFKRFFK